MLKNLSHYIAFVMGLFYLALGYMFLATDALIQFFPANRQIVGWLLLVFAIYRMTMTVLKIKKAKREEED